MNNMKTIELLQNIKIRLKFDLINYHDSKGYKNEKEDNPIPHIFHILLLLLLSFEDFLDMGFPEVGAG